VRIGAFSSDTRDIRKHAISGASPRHFDQSHVDISHVERANTIWGGVGDTIDIPHATEITELLTNNRVPNTTTNTNTSSGLPVHSRIACLRRAIKEKKKKKRLCPRNGRSIIEDNPRRARISITLTLCHSRAPRRDPFDEAFYVAKLAELALRDALRITRAVLTSGP
jgi:hypothetical protein